MSFTTDLSRGEEGMSEEELKTLIYQFIGSLTLCDDIGGVCDCINEVLEKLGDNIEWDDLSDLADILGKRGVTTLHGTSLGEED